jgi:murein DD-endopeptidase MepM/ murein hydrolase activator NlpD
VFQALKLKPLFAVPLLIPVLAGFAKMPTPAVPAAQAEPPAAVTQNVSAAAAPVFAKLDAAIASTENLPALSVQRTLLLHRGQSFKQALTEAGFSAAQVQSIQKALAAQHLDAAKIKPGQPLTLSYTESAPYQIGSATLGVRASMDKTASLTIKGAATTAQIQSKPIAQTDAVAVGHISGSLWEDATSAGLPANLIKPFVDLFSWDVDFTREIQPGDTFKVQFEAWRDEHGVVYKTGRITAAELIAKGKRRTAFLYNGDYYDEHGETKKKLLLKTPLEVFRISSSFGARKHPVLGFTRMHKGTDFAAPFGTPIKASGDGVVSFEGWHGGHGNYILVHHNATYDTGYAHISRFAPGVKKGSRVRQGQIIAYVGSTGLSTGPHLHYEVHIKGVPVDPMNTKLPTSVMLAGAHKTKFFNMVNNVQTAWAKAFNNIRVASR